MGKNNKFKQIRKLAISLPKIPQVRVVTEHFLGSELIEQGIDKVEGKPIDEKGRYSRKKQVLVDLNHEEQMKKIYLKSGIPGVNQYAREVVAFNEESERRKAMKKMEEDAKLAEVSEVVESNIIGPSDEGVEL